MEGPLQSPRQFSPGSRPLPDPGPKLGDWGCPLRRNFTLLDDSLLATINDASYQRPIQFSAKCCLKNTYFQPRPVLSTSCLKVMLHYCASERAMLTGQCFHTRHFTRFL